MAPAQSKADILRRIEGMVRDLNTLRTDVEDTIDKDDDGGTTIVAKWTVDGDGAQEAREIDRWLRERGAGRGDTAGYRYVGTEVGA